MSGIMWNLSLKKSRKKWTSSSKNAKKIRRYKYTIEQNLEPIEVRSKGFKNPLIAYEEAAKRANLDGAWSSSSLLMCRVSSHTFVDVQGVCLCWCVWSDSTTIENNVMDKLSPSMVYLHLCGQVISLVMSVLSQKICVCWLCLYVETEAMRDGVDLSVWTDSKEMMINKPPSHLFTTAALPLHSSEECSQTLIIGLLN
jgi:hypothetical protein